MLTTPFLSLSINSFSIALSRRAAIKALSSRRLILLSIFRCKGISFFLNKLFHVYICKNKKYKFNNRKTQNILSFELQFSHSD